MFCVLNVFSPRLLHLTAKTRATSQFRAFSSLLSDYVNWHHRAISQRFAFPIFLFCVQIIRFPECFSRFLIWSFWFMIAAKTRAILQRFAFFLSTFWGFHLESQQRLEAFRVLGVVVLVYYHKLHVYVESRQRLELFRISFSL